MTAVFMFPGQGSQKPGMGAGVVGFPEAAAVLECASDIFGLDVRALLLDADAQTINETLHAQVAIVSHSSIVSAHLRNAGVMPEAVLGFSLGQIAALETAGMLSREEMFRLLKARAECMETAVASSAGAMSAFLGGSASQVEETCSACAEGAVLVPANYNCPGQTVISGEEDAVARAEAAWKSQGGKSRRLATAGAFHSPLMAGAAESFSKYLAGVSFAQPSVPLVSNVDALPLSADDAAKQLATHLVSPVRFEQSVADLIAQGSGTFVEVGFGKVLQGLVRKIDADVSRMGASDEESCDAVIASLVKGA